MNLQYEEQNIVRTLGENINGFDSLLDKMREELAKDFVKMTADTLAENQAEWKAIERFRNKVVSLSLDLSK